MPEGRTTSSLWARRVALSMATTIAAALVCVGEGGLDHVASAQTAQRPNIVFVLTDDQMLR